MVIDEPTNRELKLMLDHVQENFTEKHDDVMEILNEIRADVKETKAEAKNTNGKVARLYWWKNGIVWLVAALVTLMGASYPILKYIVQKQIEDTVQASLAQFNIIVK